LDIPPEFEIYIDTSNESYELTPEQVAAIIAVKNDIANALAKAKRKRRKPKKVLRSSFRA
jgi:hypothetical protein